MTFPVNPRALPGVIELKGDEADPAEIVTKALNELKGSVDDRLKASTDRLDKLEARLNRPGQHQADENGGELERKAFESFARVGIERMSADEQKALTVSNDTAGGYLAPEQFMTELDKNLVLFSPIRSIARVASASAGELLLPKRTSQLTASWVGETDDRSGTQPGYGQQKFVMHELACYVDVSNRLLEDSAFDLESELARDFAEEFGRSESLAFIGGDGVNKPEGLLLNDDIEQIMTDATGKIDADDLIDLFHALPSFYATNGTWAMNRATMGAIRKLKDASGSYLWQDAISAGNPATILGRPVIEFPDMPNVGGGQIPVVFGDFRSGFRIFDRTALSVLRDPYTMQTKGQVRFHARRRVGGAVSKAEALKFLKVVS